jgi:GNAT superfamily N-acetyltransferase
VVNVSSSNAFSIRPATDSDAEAILQCLQCAFAPYRNEYTAEAYLDTVLTRDTIGHRLASMNVLVAAATDGDIIGTIAASVSDADIGHLRGMAVQPEWQGKGVADQLLATAERHLRHCRCTRVTLDTTAPLRRAIRFYERHGYKASGQVTNFFGMALYEYEKNLLRGTEVPQELV